MAAIKLAIGLMSGTSMDGIDVAMLRSDGNGIIEIIAHNSINYNNELREKLKRSLILANAIENRNERPYDLKTIEQELTEQHSLAVKKILKENTMEPGLIDLIGFHGQTVLHKPEKGLTVQIGDGQQLANETGINVIFDMRANDMLHGGQGAPLVPVYHRALANKLKERLHFPVAFINIGGIANLSWVGEDNSLYAFDCGPGNALIDQWMTLKAARQFDEGGKTALQGKLIANVIETYQHHKFFHQQSSGSLDWRSFSPLEDDAVSLEDGAATLSFITAYGIINSFRHLPHLPKTLILSGGGAHNLAIIKYLKELTKKDEMEFLSAQSVGLHPDFIEAEAWAYLAIRSWYNLPLTYPTTTGCFEPVSGGILAKPTP